MKYVGRENTRAESEITIHSETGEKKETGTFIINVNCIYITHFDTRKIIPNRKHQSPV